MPTPMRSTPWSRSGTMPPRMNCAQNSAKTMTASRSDIVRFAITATANTDCAAVRKSSSRCTRVDGQTVEASRRDREDDRQRADQQRPLVHLRGDERAETGVRVEPPGVEAGDQQLRRLRRQRCDPLHQEELADAERRARCDERFGEPFGEGQDHRRGEDGDGHDRPFDGGTFAKVPRYRAGPTRCGSSAGARATRIEYSDEDRRPGSPSRSG